MFHPLQVQHVITLEPGTVNLEPYVTGEVAERLKALLSKSSILSKTGSWVRIPPSPPGGSIHRLVNRS